MNGLTLLEVKQALRVIHDADDDLLQMLLDSAVDEAKQFCNRDELPSDDGALAPSVFTAVCCLVKADYEAAPDDVATLRQAAETKLMPYRVEMGV